MRGGQINGYLRKWNGRKLRVAQMAGDTLVEMRWTFPVSVIGWRIAAEPFLSVVSHLVRVPMGYTIALEMSLNGSQIGMIRPTLGRIRQDLKQRIVGCYEAVRGVGFDLRCSVRISLGAHRTIEDSASVFDVHVMQSNS